MTHHHCTPLTQLWYVAHMTLEAQDTLPPSRYQGPWWHTSSGKRAGPTLSFHWSHTSTNLHADKNTLCLAGLHATSCRWVFCIINRPFISAKFVCKICPFSIICAMVVPSGVEISGIHKFPLKLCNLKTCQWETKKSWLLQPGTLGFLVCLKQIRARFSSREALPPPKYLHTKF